MNTKDERNEHFQGFAKLLWQRLQAEIEYGPHHGNLAMQKPALETLIAQCAYDLVYHSFDNIWEVHNPEALISKTPDLTEWPTPPAP